MERPATGSSEALGTKDPTSTPRVKGAVSRSDYGEDWPFTVEEGVLQCEKLGGDLGGVTLEVDGTIYGINGPARGSERLKANGWRDGNEIQTGSGNVGRIIEDGQKLC